MHTSPGSQSAVRRRSETARSKQSGLEQESFEDADVGSCTKLRLIGVCNNKKNNKKTRLDILAGSHFAPFILFVLHAHGRAQSVQILALAKALEMEIS